MSSENQTAYRIYSRLFEDDQTESAATAACLLKSEEFAQRINNSIIGARDLFQGPFGPKKITYCDHTASGKALSFLEDYIQSEILPMYGNTHTSTSITGLQTTLFREEARNIIGRCCGYSKDDEVIFAGNGATAAVNLLCKLMQRSFQDWKSSCVVFVGPFEHHSNILPWRESGAKVVEISEDFSGDSGIDLKDLQRQLDLHKSYKHRIGAFSAASNVSGIISNIDAITALMHENDGLCFWDYASAAPYLAIDMNPANETHSKKYEKDAVFISPHKMIGGVGSSGCLIVKKKILAQSIHQISDQQQSPFCPGGGTVFFVTADTHRFLDNFKEREVGGTPNIMGDIRAGLVFQVKEAIGQDCISEKEHFISQSVFERLGNNPNVVLMGNEKVETNRRLPIFSFLISHEKVFLHYNYVCSLLNDLFGIQSRGGCVCAGPYSIRLLGMDDQLSKDIESQLLRKNEILRPGYTRLNLAWFMENDEIEFVCKAIEFVAEHGWKFLPLYGYHIDSGEWRHRSQMTKSLDKRWLGDISYESGMMRFSSKRKVLDKDVPLKTVFDEYLLEAEKFLTEKILGLGETILRRDMVDQRQFLDAELSRLRWFLLPSEAHDHLISDIKGLPRSYPQHQSPFNPKTSLSNTGKTVDKLTESVEEFTEKMETTQKEIEEEIEITSCKNCFHRHTNDHILLGSHVPECINCECVDYVPSRKRDKCAIKKVEKKIKHLTGKAIKDFAMAQAGDRIMVALSGGKDSLTLLNILLVLQKRSPVKFDIGACTIDPEHPEYDPSPLKKYLKSIGVPYFYEERPILKLAETCMDPKSVSICSFCARMKRGTLYSTARREGYNVIAMGQHLDDLAESFLMSAFHNGSLRTMKANYHVEEGDIRIIRPLVYVRERLTRQYANLVDLPIVNENCPACFEAPQERARIKQVLAAQEHIHPDLFSSLLKAMRPLMEKENRFFANSDEVDGKLSKILK